MNLDKFLKSQTFKTGVFVLSVIFILVVVFKLGVGYGYKKAIFYNGYNDSYNHDIIKSKLGSIYKKHIILKKEILNKEVGEKVNEESDIIDTI